MKHIGLFEGIGGFSLAARWIGWNTVAWCEWNPFGQKVLRHHFPEAEGFGDITKTDFTKYANTIDIVTGGFPCQPFSLAGKRKGKEDERHLWPEMFRAIRAIQPSWIVCENVPGLISWSNGMVFNEVQTDLENSGFEIFPPVILPACGITAPHRRDRIWFVAYNRYNSERKAGNSISNEGSQTAAIHTPGQSRNAKTILIDRLCGLSRNDKFGGWEKFPTEPILCSRDNGISERLDGITFSKWRTESIKAYGNAIVPQVALQILKAIAQMSDEMLNTEPDVWQGKKNRN